jgi:glycine/D-amino acid oxidase-like deaminating enzyme
MESTDFLIVGAGIVGLAVAHELRQRHPKASIVVLEKESKVGLPRQRPQQRGFALGHLLFPRNPQSEILCRRGTSDAGLRQREWGGPPRSRER